MKRVIVLSWLKTFMNRFIGPDDDSNEKIEEELENTLENDPIEKIERVDRKLGPSFRFPIISDAEIYGWDDDPTQEQEYPKADMEIKDSEEDYETKPLFENERWPGDSRPVNVYRAGSTQ